MPKIGWDDYEVNDFWDELITSAGEPRPAAADLAGAGARGGPEGGHAEGRRRGGCLGS